MAQRTPQQTIGPFFHEALRWQDGASVTFAAGAPRIRISGRIIDGAGDPVADALVETWQRAPDGNTPAGASGGSNPHGFARLETDPDGAYRIETAMPGGAVPFIDFMLHARGLLKPLRTRVYLASEAQVRADPALAAIADSPRVRTLIARDEGGGRWRWDIRLQGEGETVFFAA